MTLSTARFDDRRRLLQVLGALPAGAILAGLTACGGGGGEPEVTVADRRAAVASDVTLHVRDWQTAPTRHVIVLLAGLGANAHCFDSLAPALARHARVLAVSRRGYGQSDKPLPGASRRYDPPALVADLLALLDALGIDRVVLAGHSIAGNELTLFAGRHPQRVRGLVYLDTTFDYTQPVPWDGEPPPDNPALEEPQPTAADHASLAAAIAFAKRVNKNWFPAQEANLRDALEASPDGRVRSNTPAEVQAAMENDGHAFSPDYAAVRAPALVVTAEQREVADLLPWLTAQADARTKADARTLLGIWRQVRRLDADRLAAALPGCRRVNIDNSNHSDFFIEHQDQVVRAIEAMRWLQP